MVSTSLSQRWLSEVEAIGTLINFKSLSTTRNDKGLVGIFFIDISTNLIGFECMWRKRSPRHRILKGDGNADTCS